MFSIVIPTYNHCDDLLKPCIESIKKFTNLSNVEVIVSANGCKDNTKEYVESLGAPFRLVWNESAIGFPKAVNAGIREAKHDYIIILNNDIILLDQEKDSWVNLLHEPFKINKKVAITGPLSGYNETVGRSFVIFFCVMLSKKALDDFGLLDESFGNGFFEDTDLCWRAEDAGYQVTQVPANNTSFDGQNYVGQFPIFHKGHATFKNTPDSVRECWYKNQKTVEERYLKIKLDKAKKCDGYMSDEELSWLARQAKKHKVIVELGSWHGKSTRALGDNTDGIVYAIDHFNGSATESMNHGSARLNDGDHAFLEFCTNNFDLIKSGKIVPLRGTGKNMCKLLKDMGVKADMIFIDGGHTYEEVVEDINNFKDILALNGVLCGHDYGSWVGVSRAVDEKVHGFERAINTSIWYVGNKRGRVYDCFPFFNELEVLDIRLHELDSVVDFFVIAEANKTHTGKDKPFYFEENKDKFKEFLHKIVYVKVDDMPVSEDPWVLERFQRDALNRGLTNCNPFDIIIISDADEIPSAKAVESYKNFDGLRYFDQKLFYYFLNCHQGNWDQAKIIPFSMYSKGHTPCQIRYTSCEKIPGAGWHFSYMGGVDRVVKKIESFAHQERNLPEVKNKDNLSMIIDSGKDLYGRDSNASFLNIDSSFPKYIFDKKDYFSEIGWIKNA